MSTAKQWTVAHAKAHLSQVIDQAIHEGPQTITRHGKNSVVVVSAEEWDKKTRRNGNLAEFFARSPLRNSGLVVRRDRRPPRELVL